MPIRLIHVGLGGWGRDWEANAIPPVREIERVACVDADADALAKAQKRVDLRDDQCFDSLDRALAAVEADAVLVTAPIDAHVPLAVEAMRAGKHVLVEKPFASTVEEARQAVDVAEQLGRTLMVSQNYRFYPAARTAARLLQESAVGALGTAYVDFRKWGNGAEPGTHRHYQIVHPLLFDMAIHHFDLMRMLLRQEPVRVYTCISDPPWSNFVEEASATVAVTFDGGTVVSYRGSWVSTGEPTTWSGMWRVECSEGEISWTGRGGADARLDDDAVWVRRRGSDTSRDRKDDEVTSVELDDVGHVGRSGALAEFARAITTGVEPESSGRRNLPSLALMEAAARSASSGQVEEVVRP